MTGSILLFQLIVLIFSVMVHEISHGAVALRLGDTTAKDAGHLTLNPLKHIDLFGSVILPLILSIPALFDQPTIIFGWAKPVPYNPFNLKNPKTGGGIIAAAGPLSNIFLALVFGVILRFLVPVAGEDLVTLIILLNIIVFTNVLLAIFNLLPIPPLDGSGVLFSLLPDKYNELKYFFLQYGFFILILFVVFGSDIIYPLIAGIYRFIAGGAAIF